MKILKKLSLSSKRNLILIISFFCVLMIITKHNTITSHCISAIQTCLNIVIPALFPMLLLVHIILKTSFSERTKRMIHRFSAPAFGLSGNCAEGMLLGMSGGYNTAIKTAVILHNNKIISLEEARKLAVFFTNPGISFCICLLSISVYNTIELGIFVFIISNFINCIMLFVYNRFSKNRTINYVEAEKENSSTADNFIDAVNDAGKAMISICLWILVFAVIRALIKSFLPFSQLTVLFDIFADISTGVFISAENYSVPFTVFAVIFGGLCILLQQFPDIILLKINIIKFLFVRLINASVTSYLTYLFLQIFYREITVSVISEQINAFSGSPISTMSLFLLFAVFLCLVFDKKNFSIDI